MKPNTGQTNRQIDSQTDTQENTVFTKNGIMFTYLTRFV